MFVTIMSVEICCRMDFVECHDFTILIKMKGWVDLMDVESTGKTTVHHRKVVGALRVSPAVTRLTVDRRHQVMRPVGIQHHFWGKAMCGMAVLQT